MLSRFLVPLVSLVAIVFQSSTPARTHTLMPVPASVHWSSGQVRIGPATLVSLKGGDQRMYAAALRLIGRLEGRTGFTLSHDLYGGSVTGPGPVTAVVIDAQSPGKTVPALDEDESYSLEVGAMNGFGRVTLQAPTDVGAMRGMETFLQLLSAE